MKCTGKQCESVRDITIYSDNKCEKALENRPIFPLEEDLSGQCNNVSLGVGHYMSYRINPNGFEIPEAECLNLNN